ncbi:MAG: hypothetical protein ACYCPW_05430 [Nitrososphaerales archaeon]
MSNAIRGRVELTSVERPDAKGLHGDNSPLTHTLTVRRYVEKALKQKYDYPTKDDLCKRISITITKLDLDSALRSLENEGKIMIDERDGRIVWVVPESEEKSSQNSVSLD